MDIPVVVEPCSTGFRARTGGPLDLTADGPTADAAMAALRGLVAARARAGTPLRTLSVADVDSILAAARQLRENPMYEEFEQAVADYRSEHNAVPDPDNPI